MTFANEKVQKLLADRTVAIKVDVDENPKLAREHKVSGIPCLVFLDGEGKEVGRLESYRDPEEFLEEAGKILSEKKKD